MRLDRTAALLCAGSLGRFGLLDAADAVPVLMYHSVSAADEGDVGPYYRLAVTPERFRQQMQWLIDTGCAATSLSDSLHGRAPDPGARRRVVLTFDDGYHDFLTGAWPTLDELQITATVFLPTSFIAETPQTFRGRRCLTWPEVRQLALRGITFGSHTATHPVLHGLSWPEIRRELTTSRDAIEQALGVPTTTFAYPFAFPQHDRLFVSAFTEELVHAGYSAAVTTVIGRHRSGHDALRVKRLPVNDADDEQLFKAKLAGAYDWLGVVQAAWKRLR